MNYINNERGSNLVVVLLVMLVFTVMGIGLLGATINGSTQINRTNESIQSTNLAEMGVNAIELTIRSVLERNPAASIQETLAALNQQVANQTVVVDPANKDTYYTVSGMDVRGVKLVDKQNTVTGEKITVTFLSNGVSNNEQTKTITTTIEIIRNVQTTELYNDSHSVNHVPDTQVLKTTKTYFEDFVHFKKNVVLNPPSSLTFNHNVIVDGTTELNANTEIIVKKDAHFKGELDVKTNKSNNGNLGNVCVQGTLYLYGNQPDISVNKNFTTCAAVANKNGVFAKKVVIKKAGAPALLTWDVSKLKTKTNYQK